MGDQGISGAEKVDLGKGSREEQQGGPEPDKGEDQEKARKPGDQETPAIAPRPAR